ncbi:hypothetical protein WOSG25_080910 [Weissella oryzae SG25]|uniref:Uncharacterized protein n=1 Tax=Weissella oryzae (strain DSM 25784 / JCM 18191 / LMG 30913 / SG25) TaxID=1329250 RepID=A0A069CVL5_WEIOS|nr:DsbA family protein [Weissella oryzae]GAK31258.1 hypothetical protein WOSG25_080910 [Weissella oryzae SG25]
MNEMLLFIEPLSMDAVDLEERLITINSQLVEPNKLRLIPVINIQTLKNVDYQMGQVLYQFVLDYQAVHIWGASKARQFLLAGQKAIAAGAVYNEQLVIKMLADLAINWDEFLIERNDPANRQGLMRKQRIAQSYIKENTLPLLVIENEQTDQLRPFLEEAALIDLEVAVQDAII